jgi:hypothetical protein
MSTFMYQLTATASVIRLSDYTTLPPSNNGTPEWREYQAWLDAGNEPEPAPVPPAPPVLTTEQKLEAAGLTVAELKELFGLP